jgi:hypothetical protein
MENNEEMNKVVDEILKDMEDPIRIINKANEDKLEYLTHKVDYIITFDITEYDILEHTLDELLEITYWFGTKTLDLYYKLLNHVNKISEEIKEDYLRYYNEIIEEELLLTKE